MCQTIKIILVPVFLYLGFFTAAAFPQQEALISTRNMRSNETAAAGSTPDAAVIVSTAEPTVAPILVTLPPTVAPVVPPTRRPTTRRPTPLPTSSPSIAATLLSTTTSPSAAAAPPAEATTPEPLKEEVEESLSSLPVWAYVVLGVVLVGGAVFAFRTFCKKDEGYQQVPEISLNV